MSGAQDAGAFLEAGGRRLEFRRCGHSPRGAPTLVFLHEGLGCVSTWRDFPDRVARATGLAALVYSRAGYGRSDPAPLPRPPRYMHDEALVVLPQVLAAAGVGDPVLVGHSDGASIALIHAGGGGAPRPRALVLMAPHVFNEALCVRSIRAAREAWQRGELREPLTRHHGAQAEAAFFGWNDVWLSPGFRQWSIEEYLPGLRVPVLLIQGEQDEYGTLRQLDAIEAGTTAPVRRLLLPGCRHAPHRDQPERTLESIAAFLQEVPSGAPARAPAAP